MDIFFAEAIVLMLVGPFIMTVIGNNHGWYKICNIVIGYINRIYGSAIKPKQYTVEPNGHDQQLSTFKRWILAGLIVLVFINLTGLF